MKLRSLLAFGALAAAAGLGACSKQDAGAFVGVDEFNTGVARALVRSDTALSPTAPRFAPAAGVQVQIIPLGSTTPLRTVSTVSGVATFVGLEPGQYILRPVARPGSVFTGQTEDTVTVTAAGTTSTDTLRVRLGASATGFIGAQFFNQTAQQTVRYPNVIVKFVRETGVGTGVYTDTVAVDTTDAIGTFNVPLLPQGIRYRIVFDPTTITQLTDTLLVFRGTGTPASARPLAVFTTAALTPNQTLTQNLLFNYRGTITGAVFRDLNNNEIKDGTAENMVAGDTIFIELKNENGTRTIANTRVLSTGTGAQTYTFSSLAPGTYTITHNVRLSRFPTAPAAFTRARTYQVVIGATTTTVTRDYGVPYGP